MKQSDLKTRKVMDFDAFKDAYQRALAVVSRHPDDPLQDGSRKMTAYGGHVRNDSNPYRAFGIPYDHEEADSNMRVNARAPMFVSGTAQDGEIGESGKFNESGSANIDLPEGTRVWTILGPHAGKDKSYGVTLGPVRYNSPDYVVDVQFFEVDTDKKIGGPDEWAIDYLHRVDGKKYY